MKKHICTSVFMLLLLVLSLSACTKGSPKLERVTGVYKPTELTLPEGMSASELKSSVNGMVILLMAENEDAIEFHLGFIGADKSVVSVPLGLSERESQYMLASAPDASALLMSRRYDENGRLAGYSLRRYSQASQAILSENVGGLFETDSDPEIRAFTVDTEGLIYIATRYSLVILSSDGEKLDEFELEHELSELNATSGGVLAEYYKSDILHRAYLDNENRRFGEPIEPLPNLGISSNDKLYAPGYDFYYSSDESFYGFNFTDNEPVELVNWVNSDIIKGYIRSVAVIDADNICCIESGKLLLLARVPDDEVVPKQIIELGVVYTSPELIRTIVSFNRQSEQYRVTLRNYKVLTANDNPGGASELLSADFVGRNAPDVIMVNGFVCIDELAASGALADMYEFLDSDDELGREAFFDNILAQFEYDGRLGYIPDDLKLRTLTGKSSELPEGFDAESFIEYASSLPEGRYLFEESMNSSALLSLVLENSLASFIDFENGSCELGADFAKVLEFAKNKAVGFKDAANADELADVQEDVALPYRENRISLVRSSFGAVSYSLDAEFLIGDYGEDNSDSIEAHAVGYPCAVSGGKSVSGALIDRHNGYAIAKSSRVKSGAWELVKALLFDREGKDGMASGGFSPIRELFDTEASRQLGHHRFFYLDGGSSGGSGEYRANPRNPKPGVLRYISESDVTRVRSMLEGAKHTTYAERELMKIIAEEAELYFVGEKTLDETVKIIENRVSTYISENFR